MAFLISAMPASAKSGCIKAGQDAYDSCIANKNATSLTAKAQCAQKSTTAEAKCKQKKGK